jgi:hypothetical protein
MPLIERVVTAAFGHGSARSDGATSYCGPVPRVSKPLAGPAAAVVFGEHEPVVAVTWPGEHDVLEPVERATAVQRTIQSFT